MTVTIRLAREEDAAETGRICHDAFAAISEWHRFPKDVPSREVGVVVTRSLISHPRIYSVVAEKDGKIIGSNFLDERAAIRGVGPITVDPAEQDSGAGRMLMQRVVARAKEQNAQGVRLLQDAFHNRSLALYTKLGFRSRGTTAIMQGPSLQAKLSGYDVRPATRSDVDAANRVCTSVHGHDRAGELDDAVDQGQAVVVARGGRVTGYTTSIGFFGYSVGETNGDLQALIAGATEFGGPGFHVPTDNDDLMRWCFANGLRMVKAMTLMSIGFYESPKGACLPSVYY